MPEETLHEVYTPDALLACEKALRTLLTKIGPWGSRVYLIGGLAPRYIVGELPEGMAPHVGTTDLDVVIGVSIPTEDAAVYRSLQLNLKEAGFALFRDPETQEEKSFRWHREVDGYNVILEFFCPLGDGEPGRIFRNPGPEIGSKVGALRTPGAQLVALDYVEVELRGELLDHGGFQDRVVIRVTNVLPFLVLKSFALRDRDKAKDSYDIVWTLSAHPGGVAGAVARMATSPIAEHPDVVEAIEALRTKFSTVGHRGPAQYANFLRQSGSEEERIRLRRYAFGTVTEFLRRWDGRAPGETQASKSS